MVPFICQPAGFDVMHSVGGRKLRFPLSTYQQLFNTREPLVSVPYAKVKSRVFITTMGTVCYGSLSLGQMQIFSSKHEPLLDKFAMSVILGLRKGNHNLWHFLLNLLNIFHLYWCLIQIIDILNRLVPKRQNRN